MATLQNWDGRWRAIVRRKSHPTQTRIFPTKTAAKARGDRMDRELADHEARGGTPGEEVTIGELIDWGTDELAAIRAVSKTRSGNMTRIRESLGDIVARRLTANDVIKHARRRIGGNHMMANGVIIPACSPATMNVELGYLSELLKLAGPMKGLKLASDPVAEARPVLRLLRLEGKSKRRDRRPTRDELQQLRNYFRNAAWRSKIPMVGIIDFAILTAKRESEITRLLWSDVDQVNRTALLRDARHACKNVRNRKTLPPLGDAWDIVQRQPKGDVDEPIFPYSAHSVGTAFTRPYMNRQIVDLCLHGLRHVATSRIFEQGYDIIEGAALTFHESWNELKPCPQLHPESPHRGSAI